MNQNMPMMIKLVGVALATYLFITIMGTQHGILSGAALAMIVLP